MPTPRPVCLVQPPVSFDNSRPCLDDKQYGLGMLAIAAWLTKHGFPVVGVHVPLALHAGSRLTELIELITDSDPLLVAVGLNWVHFSDGAISMAKAIKARRPKTHVFLGGQHASLFAREIAESNDCVDGVILGEAELPILDLCRSIQEDGSVTRHVAGLVQGSTPAVPNIVQNIEDLPLYSYRSLWPEPLDRTVAAISTVRGACPRNCGWCIEPVVARTQGRHHLRFHSDERIAAQMAALFSEGISRFTIQDSFFIGGDSKLIGLAAALRHQNLRPEHLNIFAHPDSFGEQALEDIASSCERVSIDYGVETGSVAVAELNYRRLDPDEVVARVKSASFAGAIPYTWWMVGLPGETEESLKETESLILRTMEVGGVPRWVSPLILFPKTAIYTDPERFGVRTRFRGFNEYASFSRTSLSEAALFGDVLTHETSSQSGEDILAASRRLRQFIFTNISILERFYANRKYAPDLENVKQTVARSFF